MIHHLCTFSADVYHQSGFGNNTIWTCELMQYNEMRGNDLVGTMFVDVSKKATFLINKISK